MKNFLITILIQDCEYQYKELYIRLGNEDDSDEEILKDYFGIDDDLAVIGSQYQLTPCLSASRRSDWYELPCALDDYRHYRVSNRQNITPQDADVLRIYTGG